MSSQADASTSLFASTGAPPSKPAIFLQDACFKHRYIRSRDMSAIVERPERLRAVTVGLAAAISRLEGLEGSVPPEPAKTLDPDDLASQLGRLNIESDPLKRSNPPVSIVQISASADILSHPAVKYVHGDIDGDVYLENLVRWIKESKEKVDKEESEIPATLSQGDLYRKCLPPENHWFPHSVLFSLSRIHRSYPGCNWYRLRSG